MTIQQHNPSHLPSQSSTPILSQPSNHPTIQSFPSPLTTKIPHNHPIITIHNHPLNPSPPIILHPQPAQMRGYGGPFPLINRFKRQRQRPIHIIHIHYPPIFVIQRYAQFLNIHRSKIFTASV